MKSIVEKYYVPVFFNHLIFLTEEERYSLYEGSNLEALGSLYKSQIVYSKNKKVDVYAKETYLKYQIDTEEDKNYVEVFPNFYKIHVPLKNIDFDDEDFFRKDECFMEDILNEEDAGKKRIFFRYKKIYKNINPNLICIHTVEIKDISFFTKSVSFVNY